MSIFKISDRLIQYHIQNIDFPIGYYARRCLSNNRGFDRITATIPGKTLQFHQSHNAFPFYVMGNLSTIEGNLMFRGEKYSKNKGNSNLICRLIREDSKIIAFANIHSESLIYTNCSTQEDREKQFTLAMQKLEKLLRKEL